MAVSNTTDLEKRLWEAADNLRANSNLSSHEYSVPVLGLIFLRYAWNRFKPVHERLKDAGSGQCIIDTVNHEVAGQL